MTPRRDHADESEFRARTPVRLGILTNPSAHRNHRLPLTHGRLECHLQSASDAVVTADSSQLDGALHTLLVERAVTVLAINGGDGTIHGAVNAIVRLLGADVAAGRARFPTLLFLNGGTYNIASRAFRTKADPVWTVRRFQQRFSGAMLSDLPTRRLGLLQVDRPGVAPMLGMVFGSQVIRNVLELCDRLGSGYVGLARLLGTGVLGSAVQSRFYRENLWRLRPDSDTVLVDGRRQRDVLGVVASTIDMKLVRGLVWALTMPPGATGFHAKVVRAKTPSEVVHLLPHLLWEIPHHSIVACPEARRLEISGDFTVDGELYSHRGPLTIVAASQSFRALSGDEF